MPKVKDKTFKIFKALKIFNLPMKQFNYTDRKNLRDLADREKLCQVQ